MNLNVDINMLRDILTGDEAYERREIAKFLYRLVEQLKVVLDNLDEENLSTEMTGEWKDRGERLTGAEAKLKPATAGSDGLMSAADKYIFDNSTVRGRGAGTEASLDSYMAAGTYWLSSATTTSGWPAAEGSGVKNAVLNVFYDRGGARLQELTMYDGNGLNRRYCRMYINSRWYPWRTITTGA